MPSLYRCNVTAPFPFNAEPLLRREIRKEYRHYFGLPGRVNPAHDQESSGSGADHSGSSLAKNGEGTEAEAAVGGYGQKAGSGIMKRSCKWFAKVSFDPKWNTRKLNADLDNTGSQKLGKMMNPFPPKNSSDPNTNRAAEGDGIRVERSNTGRNETLSSGLRGSSEEDILDARSEMTTVWPAC
jgi:hypothetical protein